ncbi:MAG: FHIPEP family type III secretion protein, partial [Candidatus Eremiobacteraeota bacterium]|nr:FHIPEP family type III secretion protein [Candidatus Eremiobacteraeota bacterium]
PVRRVSVLSNEPVEVEPVAPLSILLGRRLVGLTGPLRKALQLARRLTALELGIVLPPVPVHESLGMAPNAYSIRLRGMEIAAGVIPPGRKLAADPAAQHAGHWSEIPLAAGVWIAPSWSQSVQDQEMLVLEPDEAIAANLMQVVRRAGHELLGLEDTHRLVEVVRRRAPVLVNEVIPNRVSERELWAILRDLLRERIPIRDFERILQVIAEKAQVDTDRTFLVEALRSELLDWLRPELREQGAPPIRVGSWELADRFGEILDRIEGAASGRRTVVVARDRRLVSQLLRRHLDELLVLSEQEWERLRAPMAF